MNNIIQGDCLEILKTYPDNHFTSVITDPPYGYAFMGKKWDYDVPSIDIWEECLRVLKPGGTMLCFAGTRTQHRMAVNIEDAGFIIKDCLMWLYGSGFPKSLNVGKSVDKIQGNEREEIEEEHWGRKNRSYETESTVFSQRRKDDIKEGKRTISKGTSDFEGYGTALKPAYEPIIMCMKPNDGTYANNAIKHGVAGINIDKSRIGTDETITNHSRGSESAISKGKYGDSKQQETFQTEGQKQGRFPSNLILDEEAGQMLDQQSGTLKSGFMKQDQKRTTGGGFSGKFPQDRIGERDTYGDKGGASRFFYCAKASKSERNAGCEGLEEKVSGGMAGTADQSLLTGSGNIRNNKAHNHHPTVKPLALMKYLVNLVTPPKDGLILDPFAGSGTTILAAKQLGYDAIGIEREQEYCEIANKRVDNVRDYYWDMYVN